MRGDRQNIFSFALVTEGRPFAAEHYCMLATSNNEGVWRPELERLHAMIYQVLQGVALSVCTEDERFVTEMCGKGGCLKCGPSPQMMAAGQGLREDIWMAPMHALNLT